MFGYVVLCYAMLELKVPFQEGSLTLFYNEEMIMVVKKFHKGHSDRHADCPKLSKFLELRNSNLAICVLYWCHQMLF